MSTCPVCGNARLVEVLRRGRLPVMQNVVYQTRQAALDAPCAPFTLCTCAGCGFSFNGAFEEELMRYDESYDNDVPSPTFLRYYEELARMLAARFDLVSGTVYDVGCGKGTFLDILCNLMPRLQGVGIDPSCQPGTRGNVRLVRAVFAPEQ